MSDNERRRECKEGRGEVKVELYSCSGMWLHKGIVS